MGETIKEFCRRIMSITRKEELLKKLKEHRQKMLEFQEEFKKNMGKDSNNLCTKDLNYMNKVFEKMKMDHEELLKEYYNYKKPLL